MSMKETPRKATPAGGETTPVSPAVPKYSVYALLILSLVNFLNYIDRQVLPAVAPVMLKDPELGLNDAELGYMEAALLLSFTVLAPLFGRLGDRYPRAKIMASAAVVWSVATALTGFADRLTFMPSGLSLKVPLVGVTLALSGVALTLCCIRAFVGVGESAYSTITPSLIADYFPPQRRATALGVFQAAIPMGFALGFVIGGVLAYFFGWRAAFMIVGVPGLLTAVLVWRLREPIRGATDAPPPHYETALEEIAEAPAETSRALAEVSRRETTLGNVWRILSTRDWIVSTAGYTALTFALGAMATWATVVMERDKGMSATGAAITLGVVSLVAGATGTFGGGWLADRLKTRRHNAYFMVCAVSTLLGIVPTLGVLIADDPRVFLPSIFFAVMLLFVSNAPFHAILLESVPVHVRAMAVALNIVIIHTFGDAISRALVGVVSDSLKVGGFRALAGLADAVGIDSSRQHLSTALLIVPAALVVSTLLFFVGAKAQKRSEI